MDLASLYAEFILTVSMVTGFPDTILHIHTGLAIFFVARWLSKRRFASMVPLTAVLVAELANEVLDRIAHGSWRWPDTTSDIFHTLLWPTAISIGFWVRTHFFEKTSETAGFNPQKLSIFSGLLATCIVLACGSYVVSNFDFSYVFGSGPTSTKPKQPMTRHEFIAMKLAQFKKMDKNNDGELSPEERAPKKRKGQKPANKRHGKSSIVQPCDVKTPPAPGVSTNARPPQQKSALGQAQ